jgi:DNA primase
MQVEELLTLKKVPFMQKGKDYVVKCLSPDHDDSNPSMRIDTITGIFHCLSCGFKGNVFTFFGEKLNKSQVRKENLKRLIQTKLSESIGLVTPSDAIPYEGDWRGISSETYAKFGAFQSPSSNFVGRIAFPVKDISGVVVAFVARHTTLNHSPKYMIYPPGAKMPLFPMVAPIQGKIILVEGIFDMLNLHDKGLTNAVCSFGTRTITKDKLQLLQMQGVGGIDIIFDADDAGKAASGKVAELAEEVGLTIRNIELRNDDPGSLTESAIQKLKRKLYG